MEDSISARNFPAAPTNGRPCSSSFCPGPSPIKTISASALPSPGTACREVALSSQAHSVFHFACNFSSSSRLPIPQFYNLTINQSSFILNAEASMRIRILREPFGNTALARRRLGIPDHVRRGSESGNYRLYQPPTGVAGGGHRGSDSRRDSRARFSFRARVKVVRTRSEHPSRPERVGGISSSSSEFSPRRTFGFPEV